MASVQTYTVLIVDDDQAVRTMLGRLCRSLGTSVLLTKHGKEAIAIARSQQLTAIVLDVVLPDVSGIEVAHRLRGNGCTTPIIMISGNGTSADEVKGISAGADDYLVKPIDLDVFEARLRRMIDRETGASRSVCIRYGDVTLNCLERRMDAGKCEVRLTALDVDMLRVLMEAGGEPVPLDKLASKVWRHSALVATNAYRVEVSRIRKKLRYADSCLDIQYVDTLGYRLVVRSAPGPSKRGRSRTTARPLG